MRFEETALRLERHINEARGNADALLTMINELELNIRP